MSESEGSTMKTQGRMVETNFWGSQIQKHGGREGVQDRLFQQSTAGILSPPILGAGLPVFDN